MNKIWTDDNTLFLKENYHKLSNIELVQKLNMNIKSIYDKAYSIGLKKKFKSSKYIVNHHCLDVCNNDIAYILGYIMADGNIYKNYLQLECNTQDISIIQFIKDILVPNYNIRFRIRNLRNYCYLNIGNKLLIEKLAEYNIVPRKTGNEKLPLISKEFHGDYLRGLFDGDGCITLCGTPNKKYPSWNLCSHSKTFLEQINNILNNTCGIYKSNDSWSLATNKFSSIQYIFNIMYTSQKFCLKRKYNKFLKLGFIKDA